MSRIRTVARLTAGAGIVLAGPALLFVTRSRIVAALSAWDLRSWLRQPLTDESVTIAAVASGVLLWTMLAAALVAHLAAAAATAHRLRLPRLHMPRPVQGLTATLVGAASITAVAAPVAAAPTAAGVDTAHPPGPPRYPSGTPAADTSALARVTAPGDRAVPETVTVQRGDSLWTIAGRHLEDPSRWKLIYRANRDRYDQHGRMQGGHHIEPGWRLRIPTPATARPATPQRPAPPPSAPPGPATPPPSTPDNHAGRQATTPAVPKPTVTTPTAGPAGTATPNPSGTTGPDTGCPDTGNALPDGLLEAGMAAAALSATAALYRNRRGRHRASVQSPPGDGSTGPAGPAAGTRLDRAVPSASRSAAAGVGEGNAGIITPGVHLRWPPAGLGLAGAGAAAAARGLLVSTLAGNNNETPHAAGAGVVVTPATTWAALLNDAPGPGPTSGVIVTDGLAAALDHIDELILRRSRLTDLETPPDGDPLPVVLLLVDAPTHSGDRDRLARLLHAAAPLALRGLVIGHWEAGTTVTVDDDGTVVSGHLPERADAGPLPTLTVAAAAHTLATLTARGTAAAGSPAANTESGRRPPAAHSPDGGATPATPAATPAVAAIHINAQDRPPASRAATDETATAHPSAAREPGSARVQVLGRPQILGLPPRATDDKPLRPQSLELLVYLIARGGAADRDQILEDLLGDVPHSRAPHRLHTYAYNLRINLAKAGGPATYVGPPAQRYALNRDALDVDLWRMQDAITAARTSTDPGERVAALRRAVAAYTGPLADGCGYEWLEPYREAIRREAVDTFAALADALSDSHPDEAAAVLDTAIGIDPHAETLYQRAMRLHARLGNPDVVRRLHRDLTARLAEIDAAPTAETDALAGQLLTTPAPPAPQAGRGTAPREGGTA